MSNNKIKKIENKNGDDSCIFCNFYKNDSCTFHKVKFSGNFEPSDHICDKFDGSQWDSLMKEVVREHAREKPKKYIAKAIILMIIIIVLIKIFL